MRSALICAALAVLLAVLGAANEMTHQAIAAHSWPLFVLALINAILALHGFQSAKHNDV